MLPSLTNSVVVSEVTASADGRFWQQGFPSNFGVNTIITAITLAFKSPGPVNQNYAGAWQQGIVNIGGINSV